MDLLGSKYYILSLSLVVEPYSINNYYYIFLYVLPRRISFTIYFLTPNFSDITKFENPFLISFLIFLIIFLSILLLETCRFLRLAIL
nr:MAG TPA: hypothetical protein [Caudoviricetes sp.]